MDLVYHSVRFLLISKIELTFFKIITNWLIESKIIQLFGINTKNIDSQINKIIVYHLKI